MTNIPLIALKLVSEDVLFGCKNSVLQNFLYNSVSWLIFAAKITNKPINKAAKKIVIHGCLYSSKSCGFTEVRMVSSPNPLTAP